MFLPKIVITIGDPSGIGPEVTAKALADPSVKKICRPLVIGSGVFFNGVLWAEGLSAVRSSGDFIDIPADGSKVISGRNTAAAGKLSYEYILKAVELIKSGRADAMVTAPISKAALMLAGVPYSGHTELLAALSGTASFVMMMTAEKVRTAMVTRHMPVVETGKNLTIDGIMETVQVSWEFLKTKYKIPDPRIAVSALNPHAGEGGILGKEENAVITPAVRALKAKGVDVTGPLPADSLWVKLNKKEFDLGVFMYHDQVMIGLKCINPGKVVNITAGLPFIRTSPGHGTGFDIAGKHCADPTSMIEAIKTATALFKDSKI